MQTNIITSRFKDELHRQAMMDQVEDALTQVGEDDAAAQTATDQLASGARWLCKMLGALVKSLDPQAENGTFYAQANQVIEDAQTASDGEPGAPQQFVDWLYACVHMTGVLTDGYTTAGQGN